MRLVLVVLAASLLAGGCQTSALAQQRQDRDRGGEAARGQAHGNVEDANEDAPVIRDVYDFGVGYDNKPLDFGDYRVRLTPYVGYLTQARGENSRWEGLDQVIYLVGSRSQGGTLLDQAHTWQWRLGLTGKVEHNATSGSFENDAGQDVSFVRTAVGGGGGLAVRLSNDHFFLNGTVSGLWFQEHETDRSDGVEVRPQTVHKPTVVLSAWASRPGLLSLFGVEQDPADPDAQWFPAFGGELTYVLNEDSRVSFGRGRLTAIIWEWREENLASLDDESGAGSLLGHLLDLDVNPYLRYILLQVRSGVEVEWWGGGQADRSHLQGGAFVQLDSPWLGGQLLVGGGSGDSGAYGRVEFGFDLVKVWADLNPPQDSEE